MGSKARGYRVAYLHLTIMSEEEEGEEGEDAEVKRNLILPRTTRLPACVPTFIVYVETRP